MTILAYNPQTDSSAQHVPEQDRGQVCIANISPRERLKRLIGGVIPFVVAIAVLAWLSAIHANPLWRLPLFLLFAAAATGFFQWRDKT